MQLAKLLGKARREGWSKWIRSPHDERAVLEGCRFDMRAAQRVQTFFTKFLRHSKGQWAGQPFTLLDWQMPMMQVDGAVQVGPLSGPGTLLSPRGATG